MVTPDSQIGHVKSHWMKQLNRAESPTHLPTCTVLWPNQNQNSAPKGTPTLYAVCKMSSMNVYHLLSAFRFVQCL